MPTSEVNKHGLNHFGWLAILTIFILFGAGYCRWDDLRFKNIKIDFDKEIVFGGRVIDDPDRGPSSQTLTVQLNEPHQGRVSVKLRLYPEFYYGDQLVLKGKIKKPPAGSYGNYLAKERINGLSDFPETKREKSGQASAIKASLFKFKHSILNSYQKILKPSEAALLAALTLGERGGLNKEFKEKMSLSGTSHLAVVSGLHITVVGAVMMAAAGYLFPPLAAFVFAILALFGLVAMTGFGFSAVRAAIMGLTVLLAKLAGRIYDPRNSIALAALLIILFSPKAMVFDLGFQLSFLAVLGIVYLQPAFKKLLKFKEEPGFLGWRENFLITLSAQAAVAPILIVNFGNFSFTSLLANVLILMAIPLTMILGFFIGFFQLFSYYLSWLTGWLVSLFLEYEIFIINLFAKINLPFNPRLSFWAIIFYYLALLGIIIVRGKSNKAS